MGEAALGDAGADADTLVVGRMLAESGFASSLRRHLWTSAFAHEEGVACLRLRAIENGRAGVVDLLFAHRTECYQR